jgi:hypothetical protein
MSGVDRFAAPLHNRNRPSEGLKNPAEAAFLTVIRRAISDVVNNSD